MTENLPEKRLPTSQVEIAGKTFYYKSVSNCHTCQSPHRDYIEDCILTGMSYVSIAESLEDMRAGHFPHPNALNVSNHYNRKHMPIADALQRALIEERAHQKGRDIQKHIGPLMDHHGLNELIIQRGLRRLQDGEIAPSMADTLAAIRQQHTMEQSMGDGLDAESMQEAMFIFMEIARQYIPPDKMSEYGRALTNNPILRAMLNKQAAEAEVVSDEE